MARGTAGLGAGVGEPGSVRWAGLVSSPWMDLVQGTVWTPHRELVVLSRSTGDTIDGSALLTLSKYAPSGELLWSRELRHVSRWWGLGFYDVRNLLAVGPDGSLVLAGHERGDTHLGGEWWVHDAYLAKLDADGNPLWARSFPVSEFPLLLNALAVDARGAIAIGGVVTGPVDFGGQTLERADKAFVARYLPDGTLDWVRAISPEPRSTYGTQASVNGLAVDAEGNVVAAGSYTGTLFPGGATASGWIGAPFLIQWNAQGEMTWGKDFGALQGELLVAGGSPDGHVAAAGRFLGQLSWGGTSVTADSRDYWTSFLVVAGARGEERAARSLREAHVGALTVDPRGRVYVGGNGPGDLDLGGGPMMETPLDQLFVARYSLDAAHEWSRTFANARPGPWGSYLGDRYVRSLAVTPGRSLVMGGNIQLPTDFGGTVLAPMDGPDAPYVAPDGFLLQLGP
ncbi:hypothetical protein NR798_01035 [Archangium gephyra]|uniref:hypothetical protein n=1 Tax=Archangium gephyra TaxID=48 RepID=UPI0035D3DD8F